MVMLHSLQYQKMLFKANHLNLLGLYVNTALI